MPNDSITSKLTAAKSTLAHASKAFPSSMAPKPAPKPAAPAPKPAAPASGRAVTRQQNIEAVSDVAKSVGMSGVGTIGTLHNGGLVPKDGPYQLKAGEHVLTAAEAKNARKHALMASGMKSLAKSTGKSSSSTTSKRRGE